MYKQVNRRAERGMRHLRLRKKLKGTPEVPRLSVFRSLRHISAQLIDDVNGVTLAAAGTGTSEIRESVVGKKKTEQAAIVGKLVGERAITAGVKKAVFDRGGNAFHGRVKVLCDAARDAGLEI